MSQRKAPVVCWTTVPYYRATGKRSSFAEDPDPERAQGLQEYLKVAASREICLSGQLPSYLYLMECSGFWPHCLSAPS